MPESCWSSHETCRLHSARQGRANLALKDAYQTRCIQIPVGRFGKLYKPGASLAYSCGSISHTSMLAPHALRNSWFYSPPKYPLIQHVVPPPMSNLSCLILDVVALKKIPSMIRKKKSKVTKWLNSVGVGDAHDIRYILQEEKWWLTGQVDRGLASRGDKIQPSLRIPDLSVVAHSGLTIRKISLTASWAGQSWVALRLKKGNLKRNSKSPLYTAFSILANTQGKNKTKQKATNQSNTKTGSLGDVGSPNILWATLSFFRGHFKVLRRDKIVSYWRHFLIVI